MTQYSDLPDSGDEDGMALESFIAVIVGSLVRGAAQTQLLALAEDLFEHIERHLPEATPDPQARRSIARSLARGVIDHTPRPDRRFAIQRAARPGVNDPCDCGSGRKYKRCCQPMEATALFRDFNLLPYVLRALPRKRWKELAGSAIDPRAVADAAAGFIEAGHARDAVALLEPWFPPDAPIAGRLEDLLDILIDAYGALGQPVKKKRLIARALKTGDAVIRSSMRQRLATIAADDGDFDAAWALFHEAQRDHPDSPSLSHLEVVLLTTEGRTELARERARFWIARLQRLGAEEHAGLIALLRTVAEDGAYQAMSGLSAQRHPEIGELQALLASAPAPAVEHALEHNPQAPEMAFLRPEPPLAAALAAWRDAFPQAVPPLTALDLDDHPAWQDSRPWLACLRQRPELWQSFEVLDDVILALTAIYDWGMQPLRDALLERAETLLRLTLAGHADAQLAWAVLDNRPALRLLAHTIEVLRERRDEAFVERMQWMLALNPTDNHGYRTHLMADLLERGEVERAVALGARYPADPDLAFAQALALYASGQSGRALTRLADAHAQLPLIAPMLAAAKPRKPAMKEGWIRYGGADHAWRHRETFLAAWQRYDGALPWLRSALRSLGKAAR